MFRIDCDAVADNLGIYDEHITHIRDSAADVRNIKTGIPINYDGMDSILERLDELCEKILDGAAQMKSMQTALDHIINTYRKYEGEIISSLQAVNTASGYMYNALSLAAKMKGSDKRDRWEKILDWLCFKKINTDYVATAIQKERAADLKMISKIGKLKSKEKYSENTWINADINQRKKILNSFMKDVAKIMGVDIYSSIAYFTESENNNGEITVGRFDNRMKRIYINEYYLKESTPHESFFLMTTVVHELRHAYQHAAIENPTKYLVSKETIDIWKHDFEVYDDEVVKGYDKYRELEVERDARVFAEQE